MGRARVRAGLVVGAGLVIAAAFACSDPYGLTGPDADKGSEAGASDVGALDGPSSLDATPAEKFCAKRDATICDDFEHPLLDIRWSTAYGRGPNVVTTISDAGVDGSGGAFRASFDAPSPVEGGPSAFIHQRRPAPVSKLACGVDLFLEGSTTGDMLSTVLLGSVDGAGRWSGIGLDLAPNGSKLWSIVRYPDGGAPYGEALFGALPVGSWIHVDIEIDFVDGRARLKIENGAEFTLARPTPNRMFYEVAVGVDSDQTGTASARFDNVVCDVTP